VRRLTAEVQHPGSHVLQKFLVKFAMLTYRSRIGCFYLSSFVVTYCILT